MARQGQNPAKNLPLLASYKSHRIIIPVYIPSLDGYFEHSIEILDLCLQSLRCTLTDNDAITLIINGCNNLVVDHILDYQRKGWIDQLIINQVNHGKIDSILSVARGSYEDLITFADCDAFFYPGWLEAVISIFNAFPEAGWVSSMPAPDNTRLNTASTTAGALLEGVLRKKAVAAEDDLNRFGESIGRPDMYRNRIHEHYLAVERDGVSAIIGGGHFSFSIRREVLRDIPSIPSSKFIAEEKSLGEPFDRAGYWRLSTPKLLVQHMGNTPEDWMYADLARIQQGKEISVAPNVVPGKKQRMFVPYKGRVILSKLIKKFRLFRYLPELKN